ncbi:hypothetical protein VNO78_11778 [Psophocarpus tetragonolobus]|uniref:RING-type E3 ubiquitin transferase n=1 Tax=Psophocarpus tetragonolobus TaxID=3891 RepID=A0AAN9XNI2_PSOTE
MPAVQGSVSSYDIHVITELMVKPKPGDLLRVDVTVIVRYHTNYFHHVELEAESTLLETSIPITCESFLENNQDFLESFLSNDPMCSAYFIPESLHEISEEVVSLAQTLFRSNRDDPESDSQCRGFPLKLHIAMDVVEDGESYEDEETEHAIIQESMQQAVTMIPASDDAFNLLKPFVDSLFLKTEVCNVCLEKFCVEDVNLPSSSSSSSSSSSMPCGHVFHHHCIVKWLQLSHVCPLCRYPMPTCNPYFIPEILDQISQRIVPMVQRVLEVRTFPSDSESADSECQEIPFDLNILVHLIEEEESEEGNEEMEDELAFIEESMQQSVMMVPASTEAINSLTPLIDPLLLKTENCSICVI